VLEVNNNAVIMSGTHLTSVYIIEEETSLKELQLLVGGYIEVHDINDAQLVLNEDGKLLGLPINTEAMEYVQKEFNLHIKTGGYKVDELVGNVVILKGKGKLT
jgi:hypothetical protein